MSWPVTRCKPGLLCWLFNRRRRFSHDFGTWWVEDRLTYEVRCLYCRECWQEERAEKDVTAAETGDRC